MDITQVVLVAKNSSNKISSNTEKRRRTKEQSKAVEIISQNLDGIKTVTKESEKDIFQIAQSTEELNKLVNEFQLEDNDIKLF